MSISRRNFLKVAGGTAGVLALAGCNSTPASDTTDEGGDTS